MILSAPVVLFTYNRPEHARETIESLSRNRGAKNTDLFVFCDGAKDERDAANVKLVQDYIRNLHLSSCFRSIEVSFAQKNMGLANSIIRGVSRVLESHDEVIVLEDDLVIGAGFLEYMNEALAFFRENKTIWSISGYAPPIELPKDYAHDLYVTPRACSTGWGTWADRWQAVDWAVADYQQFKVDVCRRLAFNRGGLDMSAMLDAQMQGKMDSWAIRWCYSQFVHGSLTVYPVHSYVKNIGMDGSGTHSGVSEKYDTTLALDDFRPRLTSPIPNRTILRRVRNLYLHPVTYALSSIKRYVVRAIRSVL